MSELSKEQRAEIKHYLEEICRSFREAGEFFSEGSGKDAAIMCAEDAPKHLVVEFLEFMEAAAIEVCAVTFEIVKTAKELPYLRDTQGEPQLFPNKPAWQPRGTPPDSFRLERQPRS
jgi:hypothetical protein